MNKNTLNITAGVSGGIATAFAVDGYNLLMANDLSVFGYAVLPWIIGLGFAVCGLALIAKVVISRRD